MSVVKLTTGTKLGEFLDNVIKEGIKDTLYQKALQEKEKQAAAGGTQADTEKSSGGDSGSIDQPEESDSNGDEQPSKTVDDESEKLSQGDVTVDDIVDKLNAIRSGKSFKDEAVSRSMSEYVESLSSAERVALLAFLRGIAQIITGEVAGEEAEDPSEDPSDVEMTKGGSSQKRTIRPNIIKGQAPKKKEPGSEDTSAPSPIVPKKK